jgi:hypothetical protein
VVIDEAEKLGDNPIMGKIAAEGRKYGIGVIAISQRAKLIDKDLRGNAAMLISFGIKEPEELNYVANFISGGNESSRFIEVKKALRNIGRGNAVVLGACMRNPIIVRFNRCDANSESVEFRISELSRNGIKSEDLLRLISDDDSVEEKIENMVSKGELKRHEMVCGKYSGTWYISSSHNSAEHDIAVNIIGRHLLSVGIRNRVYNSSYGPDIVAYSGGNRIAVEYETGSKDIESSIGMIESRKKRYSKTVVVVNDSILKNYQERLGNVIPFSRLEEQDFDSMVKN